ncbi:MAG TPA: hypothetical protein VMV27_17785 [Candidatus Binataceae bacterium]|nr:hypothetical protein [Candidatus Binataceae bacterium]
MPLRRSFLLILIPLALLLFGARSVSGSNEKHQDQTAANKPSGKNKSQVAAPSFTIVVQPAPVQIIQPSPAIEQNKPKLKWYQRPTVTDWGILWGTFVYALISLGLLNATRTQATLANRSLGETRKAADAAQKSADVSEKALALAERPHLIVHSFKMEGFVKRIPDEEESMRALPELQKLTMPRILRVTYTLQNYGKSPAFLDIVVIRFRMVAQLPMRVDYGPIPKPVRGWILPPREERRAARYLEGGKLSEENRMKIVQGTAHLVVYGVVDYEDILQRQHRFAFGCRYIVGDGSDPGDRFEPIGQDEFWRYA